MTENIRAGQATSSTSFDNETQSINQSVEPRWLTTSQQEVWRSWLTATSQINEFLSADLRPFNLDLNEYEVLVVLSESPNHSIRMSALADGANQSRSRLTHTVGRMEKAGLISREACNDDRRGVLARLTDKGFALLEEAARSHVAAVREIFVDPVSSKDLEAMGRALKAILEVANSER